jgi:tetratricopeptide (TPR) repeat protein
VLQPPDTHYLSAAVGWLELGNPAEAGEEIAKISPGRLEEPDVLEVRWEVSAAGRGWEAALEVAELLVRLAPERHSGWVHRAYALRRARGGGLPQAYAALKPAFERFPRTFLISYNLACYTAQMGQLEEAWDWLQKAVHAAGARQPIQSMALADADLQPLWERIKRM